MKEIIKYIIHPANILYAIAWTAALAFLLHQSLAYAGLTFVYLHVVFGYFEYIRNNKPELFSPLCVGLYSFIFAIMIPNFYFFSGYELDHAVLAAGVVDAITILYIHFVVLNMPKATRKP